VAFQRANAAFGNYSAAFDNGKNYAWSGFPPQQYPGNTLVNRATGAVAPLMNTFGFVNGYAPCELVLGNLTADSVYEVVLYFGAWNDAPILDFTFECDGVKSTPIQVNLRDANAPGDRRLIYRTRRPPAARSVSTA
jgi:hypothetical protein